MCICVVNSPANSLNFNDKLSLNANHNIFSHDITLVQKLQFI
jgi:hypothetical protein